ncbi:signal recognition particle protein [Gemmatimonadota bacterium]
MFEELTEKLEGAIKRLGGRAVLNESSIGESLGEIRRVLLEADVNYKLVQEFLEKVEEHALGRKVIKSVSPGQMMVKIVYDELVAMLGGSSKPLSVAPEPPTIIMLVGLQGSGKTTTAGKIALRTKNQGGKPLMIAADVYRPAAIEQLQTLGRELDVPVHAPAPGDKRVEAIITEGLSRAAELGADTVLIDTAGRLHIDHEMMDELVMVKRVAGPDEVLLVVDGMTGQDAVSIAQVFNQELELSGLVLTKLDGDARGGAALSIYGITRVPIKLIGVGERLEALELFHPDRMASRLLQMGDVVTLVERAEETMDRETAEALEQKVLKQKDMDFADFLSTLKQLQKLGPLDNLLKMIPGVNSKMLKSAKVDPKRFKRIEAIILSMTPEERLKPKVLNASRRRRVAAGSGVTIQDVNSLVKQFDQMRKMMKKMGLFSGGNPAAMMRGGFPSFMN